MLSKLKKTMALFLAMCLILVVALVVTACVFIAQQPSRLPRTIWTYWNSEELPYVIKYCISTWKTHNKDHDIVLLTDANIKRYLPGFEPSQFRHADSPARVSDCIRLNILSQYGGIWMDASIICNKPLEWVHQELLRGKEFFGYYLDEFTTNPQYPVIESWFFACIPKSKFVKSWRDAFMKMNSYESVEDYIEALKSSGVDPQRISIDMQTYLAIHMAAQYVMQVEHYPTQKMAFKKAEDGPFLFLVQNGWDSDKAVTDILQGKVHTDLVKLRKDDREILEKNLKHL